jgi:hypothetical protein
MLKQMKEKALGQVTGVFGRMATMPHKPVQWIPVEIAQFAKRLLRTGGLTLRRKEHHAPPSRTKSVNAAGRRTLVRLHGKEPSWSTQKYRIGEGVKRKKLEGRSQAFLAICKISETLSSNTRPPFPSAAMLKQQGGQTEKEQRSCMPHHRFSLFEVLLCLN